MLDLGPVMYWSQPISVCSEMVVCRHQVLVPLAAPSIATLIHDVSIALNMPQTTSNIVYNSVAWYGCISLLDISNSVNVCDSRVPLCGMSTVAVID